MNWITWAIIESIASGDGKSDRSTNLEVTDSLLGNVHQIIRLEVEPKLIE